MSAPHPRHNQPKYPTREPECETCGVDPDEVNFLCRNYLLAVNNQDTEGAAELRRKLDAIPNIKWDWLCNVKVEWNTQRQSTTGVRIVGRKHCIRRSELREWAIEQGLPFDER